MIIRIQREYPIGLWSAEPLDYDMDSPIGYGKSISEAIEAFLESWEMRFNEEIKGYSWIGKAGFWG